MLEVVAVLVNGLLVLAVGLWFATNARGKTADQIMLAGREVGLLPGTLTLAGKYTSFVCRRLNEHNSATTYNTFQQRTLVSPSSAARSKSCTPMDSFGVRLV